MKNLINLKRTLCLLTGAMLIAMTAGCSAGTSSDTNDTSVSESASLAAEETTEDVTEPAVEKSSIEADSLSAKTTAISDLFSKRDLDPSYDELTATITLSGDTASADGSGVTTDGSVITITEEGVYLITGTLDDGQIIVNADKAKVQLVLDNADITCTYSAPIYGMDSDKIFITLAEGSENTLTDGSSYTYEEDTLDEPDACIFSSDSITINGSGSLTVNGNYADGIKSKDDVVITGGSITVNAAADGIKGKDYVAVADGNITINAGEDGIKSTNDTDEGMGFVYTESGSFTINAGNDGIQAETELIIIDGEFDITSGGGSANSTKVHTDDMMGGGGFGGGRGGFGGFGENDGEEPDFGGIMPPDGNFGDFGDFGEFGDFGDFGGGDFGGGDFGFGGPDAEADELEFVNLAFTLDADAADSDDTSTSTKGLKAGTSLTISGGTVSVDSADDAVHSNGTLTIDGGTLLLTAGDDGLHADTEITISDGNVSISKSYEGIESAVINIEGGTVEVNSSDDGFNASDGSSQGAMGSYASGVELNISGGLVYVNADGDGLDSNGDMTISGGTVIVDGPTNSGNGALDGNNGITVTGGVLVAAGSSGMAESPGSSSTQNSVSCGFDSTLSAGTLVTLTDGSGSEILSYSPSKTVSHIVISTPDIADGGSYTIYTGGTTSADEDGYGLSSGGYNNDGTEAGSFTADSSVSYIGTQSAMGMGGAPGMGGMGGNRGGFQSGNDQSGGFPDGELQMPTDENGDPDMSGFGGGRSGRGGRGRGMQPGSQENAEEQVQDSAQ